MKTIISHVLVLFALTLIGCTSMRTEFFREETKHLYTTGCESYKQGDYEKAKSAFEEVVSLDPDYGPAHAALGNLAMIEEDYEQAHCHYKDAIDHDPELKKDLLPFLLLSDMHNVREPLVKAGVELSTIYPLLMDEKYEELAAIFSKDLPIELLANDTVSLTPGQIGELRQKAANIASQATGPDSFRLFLSYLLFYDEQYNQITNDLLSTLIKEQSGINLQNSFVLLGRLNERMGNKKEAVRSFVAAVKAGKPIKEVAHHLARIYKVDLETILPPEPEQQVSENKSGGKPFADISTMSQDVEQQQIEIKQAAAISLPKVKVLRKSTSE